MTDIEKIARVCHEANRAWCDANGDMSQKSWDEAEEWQRQSAIRGVEWRMSNASAPNSAQHDAWMADKIADGWVYGVVKDDKANPPTHPCLVPYQDLPEIQRKKDTLFVAIVESLI